MRLQKNWLEWTVFVIGVGLVATIVVILIASAMRTAETPPQLVVELQAPQPENGRYRVPVIVKNSGDQPASEVNVPIELRNDGALVEKAELLLPFVPRNSEREASVLFTRDPRCCQLVTGAIAFENP